MEVRPIDANALLELAHNHVGGTVDCNDIARFPTLDYAPVIHARWIMRDDGEGLRRVCSRCGNESKEETPFCAHCGAKMDGGKDNV